MKTPTFNQLVDIMKKLCDEVDTDCTISTLRDNKFITVSVITEFEEKDNDNN